MSLAPEVVNKVAALLGRYPRGLEDVAVCDPNGEPMVIRVSSLVDDKPFPTLFWLVDAALNYRIDQLEATGLILQFQQRIDADPQLQAQMQVDHAAYIALREQYMSEAIRQRLQELRFSNTLSRRGIGGISNFTRIRCLHTWYGAHLAVPNAVGAMLDNWWEKSALESAE